jgi:uncharacterized repeat protein (TIGR03837 family)
MATARLWDIFCRVIDNFGDIGVCWRLATDLAARGERVRLWCDDASALAWMAPGGAAGVEVLPWDDAVPPVEPGSVVIEAFGCDPPAPFVTRMAESARPPVWINLEHLSAEPYIERSHGLPSPQRNGLTKWFFYPGFTARSGGLLREKSLLGERATFVRHEWLQAQGISEKPGELIVPLFCYQNSALPAFVQALAGKPTLLLLTPGHAQRQVNALQLPAHVRSADLPWLSQPQFDRLLWCGDLNVVRGEDSLVRAIWAGAPLLWHIYPQHDGAHDAKLQAFMRAYSGDAGAPLGAELMQLARRFNGLDQGPLMLPDSLAWRAAAQAFCAELAAQVELCTQLQRFVAGCAAGRG